MYLLDACFLVEEREIKALLHSQAFLFIRQSLRPRLQFSKRSRGPELYISR